MRRRAADERAERLLRSRLSASQLRQLRRRQSFVVRAADGTRFRIRRGWAGNVDELSPRGRAVARYCVHPRDEGIPEADGMLAQKLLLETDPARFRRVANRTPARG